MNMELSGCYRMEVKSRAFDIPILYYFCIKHYKGRCNQNIGIINALEIQSSTKSCVPTVLTSTLFT